MTQEEIFTRNLPFTLYMSHYELATSHPQFTPEEWRRYLKDNESFILSEVSAITEANARMALSNLASGTLTSSQTTAIKQLLDRSEQINSQNRDQRTFVMLQFDDTEQLAPSISRDKIKQENSKTAFIMFDVQNMNEKQREHFSSSGNYKFNADGTMHIMMPRSELDFAYLRLFNPENRYFTHFEEEKSDVQ